MLSSVRFLMSIKDIPVQQPKTKRSLANAMCGIKKRVSFHVSRHSWAVLALEYGMPIESVSKILGHTNITTTQIYAKVTSTKLDHDISVFESRIKGHLPAMGGMA